MSLKVDAERRQHAREEGVRRGREFARNLTRIVELYGQGLSDAEVSAAMGAGFGLRHVKRLRKMMGMRLKVVDAEPEHERRAS